MTTHVKWTHRYISIAPLEWENYLERKIMLIEFYPKTLMKKTAFTHDMASTTPVSTAGLKECTIIFFCKRVNSSTCNDFSVPSVFNNSINEAPLELKKHVYYK
jgi:hypothetical protein